MLQGLYSVAAAMQMASHNQEIVAENLANAATPGFRRHSLVFDSFPDNMGRSSTEGATPNRGTTSFTRLEEGPIQQTENPLDLALSGNAFFTLRSPNGPLYTRNGSFTLDATGQLVSRSNGYPVLGQGGNPIRLPGNPTRIVVAEDGSINANGTTVGRLQLARFVQPDSMRRVGSTLFQADDPQVPPPGAVRVQQGCREGSNVQAVQEMVSMMIGMRYYEAAEKSMRALSDAIAQNTRPQA